MPVCDSPRNAIDKKRDFGTFLVPVSGPEGNLVSAGSLTALTTMGNRCMRPVFLGEEVNELSVPALFSLRHPEKHREVSEIQAAIKLLESVADEDQARGHVAWDNYDSVAHRSAMNCLENQVMHITTSVQTGAARELKGAKVIKTVRLSDEAPTVIERWGDAGAALFVGEDPDPPVDLDEKMLLVAGANVVATLRLTKAEKMPKRSLPTCWEEADGLSGASTPLVGPVSS